MSQMAVSYNVNIITGSMPLDEDDVIYNVSYLCRRDGTVEEQRKYMSLRTKSVTGSLKAAMWLKCLILMPVVWVF